MSFNRNEEHPETPVEGSTKKVMERGGFQRRAISNRKRGVERTATGYVEAEQPSKANIDPPVTSPRAAIYEGNRNASRIKTSPGRAANEEADKVSVSPKK